MGNARKTALCALMKIEREGAYSNLALDQTLREAALDKRDASLASALVYGVLERRMTLDYIIKSYSKIPLRKIEPTALEILRMGVLQIVFMDKIPDSAAVNESVKLAKSRGLHSASGFINGILRSLTRADVKYTLPDIKKDSLFYYSIKYSCPKEIIKLWINAYGEETALQLLASLCGRPPLFARVNTLLTDRKSLIHKLMEEGIEASPVPFLENGLRLADTGALEQSGAFTDGLFTIQDASSQLLCEMLSPKSGQTLTDVCAAPGGKSINCALCMNNKGRVYAYDLYAHKCKLMEQAAKRLQISMIQTAVRDALSGLPLEPSDVILCDVPCSGLGVIRRKPEIRYKEDLGCETLPDLQYNILEKSSHYVKPGGVLVYSTCTLNPKENGEVASRFLMEHKGKFEPFVLPVPPQVLRGMKENSNELTLFPHCNQTDGFFISAFKRV